MDSNKGYIVTWDTQEVYRNYMLVDAPSAEEAIDFVRKGVTGEDIRMMATLNCTQTRAYTGCTVMENFEATEAPQ